MKIVLNGCYGGFGLSYEAMVLYLHAKNREAFFYKDISSYDDYTKVHKYQRITLQEIRKSNTFGYIYCTTEDQGEYLFSFPEGIINFNNIDRTDPILISVIETMGSEAASGRFALLYIEEIPNGTQYKIDNYDGIEELVTKDDENWKVAGFQYQSMQTQLKIEAMWNLIKPSPTPDPDLTFREENF